MRDRELRCFAALEKRVPDFGATFDLAQITTAVACGYESWRYGDEWRGVAPKLAAWFDGVAQRPSMKATEPAETPQDSSYVQHWSLAGGSTIMIALKALLALGFNDTGTSCRPAGFGSDRTWRVVLVRQKSQ